MVRVRRNFLLVGLPGVGKTTILNALGNEHGISVINFDQEIKRQVHPEHRVVKNFEQKIFRRFPRLTKKQLDSFKQVLFAKDPNHPSIASRFMNKFPHYTEKERTMSQGEVLWREFEGDFATYLLKKLVEKYPDPNKRPLVDIGDKMMLNARFYNAAQSHDYIPIHITADHKTICRHLMKRYRQGTIPSNYKKAVEDAAARNIDAKKAISNLAAQHRQEREERMKRCSQFTFDTLGLPAHRAAQAILFKIDRNCRLKDKEQQLFQDLLQNRSKNLGRGF